MFADEHRASTLAKELLAFDYVIIDTCSLMDDNFPFFMDLLDHSKDYIDKNLPIYVPAQCIEELKKHCKDKQDNSKRIAAKRGIKIFKMGRSKKILTLLKIDIPVEKGSSAEQYENFADRAILVKVTTDRLTHKIMVITQDKKLAGDLLRTNHLRSQFGRWLVVNKIAEAGSLKANSGVDNRFMGKPNSPKPRTVDKPLPKEVKKPQPKKEEPKPQPKKDEHKPQPDFIAKIVASDAALAANLSNPTCSLEKKVADIRAQLTELGKHRAADLKGVTLNYTQNQLEEKLKVLSAELKKEHVRRENEKREAKAKQKEAGTKLWYGNGNTLEEAFYDCAAHYGYMIRDDGVPYVPEVHKADLTKKLIAHVSETLLSRLQGERRESMTLGSINFLGQKVNGRYRAWIDVPKEPVAAMPKPEPEPSPKKEQEPTPKAEKPASKKKGSKTKKAEEPKQEPKAKKPVTEKKTPEKQEEKTPQKEDKKPAKPKKKAQKPAEKPVEKEAPKESALDVATPAEPKAKKSEPKPKKKTESAPKKSSSKKADAPKAEVKPEPKPVSEPTPKKEPKPAPKKKGGKTKKADAFDRAKAGEVRLQALIPNSNYPKEEKVKDLQAQLELINSLPKEQRNEMALQPEAIKALLSVMK